MTMRSSLRVKNEDVEVMRLRMRFRTEVKAMTLRSSSHVKDEAMEVRVPRMRFMARLPRSLP